MSLPAIYEFKYRPLKEGSTERDESTTFLLGTSIGGTLNFYLYNNFNDDTTDLSLRGRNVSIDSKTKLSLKSDTSIEANAPTIGLTSDSVEVGASTIGLTADFFLRLNNLESGDPSIRLGYFDKTKILIQEASTTLLAQDQINIKTPTFIIHKTQALSGKPVQPTLQIGSYDSRTIQITPGDSQATISAGAYASGRIQPTRLYINPEGGDIFLGKGTVPGSADDGVLKIGNDKKVYVNTAADTAGSSNWVELLNKETGYHSENLELPEVPELYQFWVELTQGTTLRVWYMFTSTEKSKYANSNVAVRRANIIKRLEDDGVYPYCSGYYSNNPIYSIGASVGNSLDSKLYVNYFTGGTTTSATINFSTWNDLIETYNINITVHYRKVYPEEGTKTKL